jgi:hypothetical protein
MGARWSALRDPVSLTVGALAVHRLTRLVTDDELTRPLRERAAEWARGDAHRAARPRLGYLLHCPWCVSPYVAAAWAALTVTAPPAAAAAGAVLAWSSVTGLLASME